MAVYSIQLVAKMGLITATFPYDLISLNQFIFPTNSKCVNLLFSYFCLYFTVGYYKRVYVN